MHDVHGKAKMHSARLLYTVERGRCSIIIIKSYTPRTDFNTVVHAQRPTCSLLTFYDTQLLVKTEVE